MSSRATVEATNITAERYLDTGQNTGSGTGDPNWIWREVAANGLTLTAHAISDTTITNLPHRNGPTDDDINPILGTCSAVAGGNPVVDPTIAASRW